MPSINPNKSDHTYSQSETISDWINKSKALNQLNNPDAIIIFSSLYSALNSLAWLYTDEKGDKTTIVTFLKNLHSQNLTGEQIFTFNELNQITNEIVLYVKTNFTDIHKLQTRTNNHAGDVVKFSIHNKSQPLSSINNIEQLNDYNVFIIGSEIMYQYRCNLVHGSKNIVFGANIQLSKYFSKMLLNIFLLSPDEAIPPSIKKLIPDFKNSIIL